VSYNTLLAEDRRLSILLLMKDAPGGTTNEALLHQALPIYGHSPSLDTVRSDLGWLAEQGLVETKEPGGLLIATITARGDDAANGRAAVPGVKKPVRR
jgi:Fe2+ or Zn2+ uptake regulation protein